MSDLEDSSEAGVATPQSLAQALTPAYDASAHPQELLQLPMFEQGVALLCEPAVTIDEVIDAFQGSVHALSAMGAEALARRDDGVHALPALWAYLPQAGIWTFFFMLRVLSRHAREPVVARLLVGGSDWWPRNAPMVRMINQFVTARLQRGEDVRLTPALDANPGVDLKELDARLATLPDPPGPSLRVELEVWQRERVDAAFLDSIGRLWRGGAESPPVEHSALRAVVDEGLVALDGPTPGSLLLVGEPGVGKTTLMRALGERLRAGGWQVFQASAADIMAGQTYVGELENRVRQLVTQASTVKRVIWYVPAFHELYYAGRHRYSPVGVLDLILPAIERGELRVVGEVEPQALEKVLQLRPRLRQCLRTLTLEELPVREAQALAARWLATDAVAQGAVVVPEVVREATELARQYLANRALPGSLIELLRESLSRLRAGTAAGGALAREVLLDTLAHLTGLPASVLDERAGLDPAGLRRFFQQRVMGQPEAVDCLVDRIAMLKAGLTDPARPVGVFLFAGPTGTGKTEVAKSLAQFLFGSADRMIRLDMSEFQDAASMVRLVGESGEGGESPALTSRVRKQPFSVVLLDEFEKAHPRVWDLFLQVFDDGRLTDAQGNLADFRHSIIILTTNVGATEHQGASLGFTRSRGDFGEEQVTRAVSRTFRPEFVNRLDRVIVFRPLSKSVMRDILKKELRGVLQRRGLRNRDWAVEWEESAIDFLLEKGFTQDMGARPLRRAIDRYVLAPLAARIVEHRAPEGDQFLFVRAGAQALEVEFVDPDAAEPATPPLDENDAGELDLRDVVSAPRGNAQESRFLRDALAQVQAQLDDTAWRGAKQEALRSMQQEGFWSHPARHASLQRIEFMDAVEAAAQSAASLAARLEVRAGRAHAPRALVGNLAQRIHLLRAALADFDAGEGSDTYLALEPSATQGSKGSGPDWLEQMARMYAAWASKRHLRLQELEPPSAVSQRRLYAITGLGAHALLSGESGIHVLEEPDTAGATLRQSVRVRVARQTGAVPARGADGLAAALRCLDALPAESRIVRRYRRAPSALVRDLVRGWRSGRFDAVLSGDFDLMRPRAGDD